MSLLAEYSSAFASNLHQPDSVSIKNSPEGFIILPNSSDSAGLTSEAVSSPFPSFYLLDTTLSTLIINQEMSIKVSLLHKVEFFKEHSDILRRPNPKMALIPRNDIPIIPNNKNKLKIMI